jgi:hypothetical protein
MRGVVPPILTGQYVLIASFLRTALRNAAIYGEIKREISVAFTLTEIETLIFVQQFPVYFQITIDI